MRQKKETLPTRTLCNNPFYQRARRKNSSIIPPVLTKKKNEKRSGRTPKKSDPRQKVHSTWPGHVKKKTVPKIFNFLNEAQGDFAERKG